MEEVVFTYLPAYSYDLGRSNPSSKRTFMKFQKKTCSNQQQNSHITLFMNLRQFMCGEKLQTFDMKSYDQIPQWMRMSQVDEMLKECCPKWINYPG